MHSEATTGKVLIIGAGVGGLVLAQILHNHGLPFEIFERDEGPSTRKQGWALALAEAIPALEGLLSDETMKNLVTTSVNCNTEENDIIAFVDAATGKLEGQFGGAAPGQPGFMIRAKRDALREYFWKAGDLPVTHGKHFISYIENENGVTAFFKDGSSSHGSLLVGADGVNSHVRAQLLGDSGQKPRQSQIIPIFGEVDLPPEQYEPLRRLSSAVILASAQSLKLQIGMLSMEKDRSRARYFWVLMNRREDPTELADWVAKASSGELYEFTIKSLKHLHPTMYNLIEYGGPKAVVRAQPKWLEWVTPITLPAGRVILLGDAAHSMTPLRGGGANIAILDGCDLGRLLIKARKESAELTAVVEPYLAKMIPRGREAVLSSRAAAGNPGDEGAALHLKDFKGDVKYRS